MEGIAGKGNSVWGGFAGKHPGLAKWLYQIFYFLIFSMGVTVFQYLVFTFMPGILGMKFAAVEFMWPRIPVKILGVEFTWSLLGYQVLKDAAGAVKIGGGLGYFISYETGSFLAQCINFPLQRNIVFRSKGNVAYQGFWYLIAFFVITCIVNSVNCIWVAVAGLFVPDFIYNIGTTVLNGGISMVIFFFVNKIIFPEGEAKKAA